MFGCSRQPGLIILQPSMVLFQMVWLSKDLVLVLDLRTIIMNISSWTLDSICLEVEIVDFFTYNDVQLGIC